jgi:hypothetical protein
MTVELIDILGQKPDGSRDLLGKGPMPPIMKIPDILTNYGLSARDFGCEEDMAESVKDAFVELVRWMEAQGWMPPPLLQGMPTHKELLVEALHRLEDVLKDDDGQAYKEAQRFVEKARKVVPA